MNTHLFSHNQEETPLHSSGYAKVARGSSIGSISAQPFSQRITLERNRSTVHRYGDSMVSQHAGLHDPGARGQYGVRSYTPNTTRGGVSVASRPMRPLSTQRSFVEPPPRHDPFA